ncbi:MAG: iron transporter [bacterium]
MTIVAFARNHIKPLLAVAALLALAFAVACSDDGLPTGPEELEKVPEFSGEVVILEDQPIAGGTMTATLEIAPPDNLFSPDGLPGGPQLPKSESDIHFEAQIRYTGDFLGGRVKGAYVPYLDIEVEIINNDTGAELETNLPPIVGLEEGFHYARNLALINSIGAAESYRVEVTISAPHRFDGNDFPAGSTFPPGIALHSDMTDLSGTVFGSEPVVLEGSFTLEDFLKITEEDEGEGDGGNEDEGGTGYGQ